MTDAPFHREAENKPAAARTITHRTQAEEALRNSEERFRVLLMASSDAVYRMSPDWNEMYDLKGKGFLADTEDTNPLWVENYIPEEDQPHLLGAIHEAIRSKSIFELEHRVIRLDGTVGWVLSRAVPVLNEQGEIMEWLGTARDMTERVRTQESQREANHAFLDKINEDFSNLSHPHEIISSVSQRLGEFLGVQYCHIVSIDESRDECLYLDRWNADGFPPVPEKVKLSDHATQEFYRHLRAGETMVVDDTKISPVMHGEENIKVGAGAFITVPFRQEGEWRYLFSVHSVAPRKWRQDEIELVEELAHRLHPRLERARAEEALRWSQQRLQRVLETDAVGVIFFNYEGTLLEANEVFLRMTGYTRRQVERRELNWQKLTPPEWVEVSEKQMEKVKHTGRIGPYEKQYFIADGSRCWMIFAGRDIGDGTIVEYVIDITDRKQMEEAIHAHQATLQSFYDSAPFLMGIAELDGDNIVAVSGNRAAAEFFATDPLALPGKTGTQLGNSEDFEQLWIEKYRRSQRKGQPVQFDYEHLRHDGSHWLRATVAFIGSGPNGNPRFSFVVEDITERKRADLAVREHQRQLQQLAETLEQRVQEKTAEVRQLASDLIKATQRERQRISHVLHDDLQQRIYAIQMQMSFLGDAAKNDTESVGRETAQIGRQLDDILRITRDLSIDLSPPILRDEGLSQAIHWLAARMRRQYGLPIEIRGEGAFAIPNEELHVLLFNCVRELLFNVVKHAAASQAVVELKRIDGILRIEVRDNGKGFAAVDPAEKHSTEDRLALSLGLPTIRHQLSLFGGRMEIHSKAGTGTQAVLMIPIADADDPSQSEQAEE